MERIPEAEIMDGCEQAEAYARADFADVNRAFVEALLGRFPDLARGDLVDLGCGPADIPIRIARALPELRITAIDGSISMLSHARQRIAEEGLSANIDLVLARLPGAIPDGRRFDAVISNSLLHHLPDPAVLWEEVRRLARPGAPVFVIDLMRPDSPEAARRIVETYAANERAILRSDFFNSLLAAFTIEEVEGQLRRAGLDASLAVSRTSDRHLAVSGRMVALPDEHGQPADRH